MLMLLTLVLVLPASWPHVGNHSEVWRQVLALSCDGSQLLLLLLLLLLPAVHNMSTRSCLHSSLLAL
jgi:hypothetical protein